MSRFNQGKIYLSFCNFCIAFLNRFGWFLNDYTYVRLQYFLRMHKKLNLKNPQTYNEKLNWLKLYDRRSVYTTMVDKYSVKAYVESKVGRQYIIPTLGVWDSPEAIEWDTLPNQFVLKTTHGGGNSGVFICKDKTKLNSRIVERALSKAMKQDIYRESREWPYKDVKKRIIAETYLEDQNTKELRDYKFFCMDGKVRALFIATERQGEGGEVKFDFYDADYNHLDLVQMHPMSGIEIPKPKTFEEMKRIASALSEGLPQVRVDLYEVNGKVYFGELTFFHHGGVVPFHPESWDYEFGSWIELPS